MIELKSIEWDNFWEIISLKVKKEQEKFILPNSVFLGQAYVNLKNNYPDMVLGIYCNDQLIGFTKIVLIPVKTSPYNFEETVYMIDAFMIDQNHQGKKMGQYSFKRILEHLKTKPLGDFDSICLLCSIDNKNGQYFFESFGFQIVNTLKKESGVFFIYSLSS